MKNIHFGAGNIGRGFIGQLLHKSGYHITFIDINELIVQNLNERSHYSIKFLDTQTLETVSNFDALNIIDNQEEIDFAIKQADLITTSIGLNILPSIAKTIANSLKEKYKQQDTKFIDIIACENTPNATAFLEKEIYKHLNELEKQFITQYVGFPNVIVDRNVLVKKYDDPLYVEVNSHFEWIIEKNKVKSLVNTNIFAAKYTTNLQKYIDRYQWLNRTIQDIICYMAYQENKQSLFDSLQQANIKNHLLNTLTEIKNLLINKYDFTIDNLDKYSNEIINRLENTDTVKDVSRLCQSPINKITYNSILTNILEECQKYNVDYEYIAKTYAYILKYNDERDLQSIQLQTKIANHGLENTIISISQLSNTNIIQKIVNAYKNS